jgi:pheromone shutdown-related protein TraB
LRLYIILTKYASCSKKAQHGSIHMKYRNLRLIGTSHIARQSLKEIKDAFAEENPDVVAVELDRRRLHALITDQKGKVGLGDIARMGVKGYLFAAIGGYVQRKLGSAVGVMPGSEMKLAVQLAAKSKANVALIDRDIEITLQRFSKYLSWKERFRFIADIFKSIFFRKRAMAEFGITDPRMDLSKVPSGELIKKMMEHLRKRYPNIYLVLVKERNKIMANNLYKIMQAQSQAKILAVVGAGHEEEMIEMIRKRCEGKADIVT